MTDERKERVSDERGWPIRQVGDVRVCARPACRNVEFRIGGYCSIYCRDIYDADNEITKLRERLRELENNELPKLRRKRAQAIATMERYFEQLNALREAIRDIRNICISSSYWKPLHPHHYTTFSTVSRYLERIEKKCTKAITESGGVAGTPTNQEQRLNPSGASPAPLNDTVRQWMFDTTVGRFIDDAGGGTADPVTGADHTPDQPDGDFGSNGTIRNSTDGQEPSEYPNRPAPSSDITEKREDS